MENLSQKSTMTPRHFHPVSENLDALGKQIVDCAFQVHKTLGPGLTENIYAEAFSCELEDKNIAFEREKNIPVQYKNRKLNVNYRLDLLIENSIILELKCVEKLLPLHEAQILAYLKLTNLRLGYLINFNVPIIKEGIKRKVL